MDQSFSNTAPIPYQGASFPEYPSASLPSPSHPDSMESPGWPHSTADIEEQYVPREVHNETAYDAILVGAGPAGATLALALAARGNRVALLEKDKEFRPVYQSELLQPLSLGILAELGVLEKLESIGHHLDTIQVVTRSGKLLSTFDYHLLPPPYDHALLVHYRQLQTILLQAALAAPNIAVYTGAPVSALLHLKERVNGVVARINERDVQLLGNLVVGADGRDSLVRRELGIAHRNGEFPHQFLAATLPRRGAYAHVARFYLGRGGFVSAYPLPNDELRIEVIIERGQYKTLYVQGIAAFHRLVCERAPELEGHLDELTNWAQVQLYPCWEALSNHWVASGAALVGDAAHAIHPLAAQGITMAVQDAQILSGVINRCCEAQNFEAEALSRYERLRRPEVEFLQTFYNRTARLFSERHPLVHSLILKILGHIQDRPELQYKYLLAISGRQLFRFTTHDWLLQLGLIHGQRRGALQRQPGGIIPVQGNEESEKTDDDGGSSLPEYTVVSEKNS